MMKRIVTLALMMSPVVSCSSGGTATPPARSGGATGQGSGGAPAASGGSGTAPGTGGSVSGTGGVGAATGGSTSATGGSDATGGSGASTGGAGGGTASGGSSAGGGGAAGGGGTTGNPGTGGATSASGGAVACAAAVPVTAGTAATVEVDLAAATLATVSPDLMGVHTAVYDGLLTKSPTAEGLLKAAGVTSLRYPGGSYADQYHWESNTANFGSFVQLLDRLGANALITVNYGMNSAGKGPGEPKEAAAWVAYANALPSSTTAIGADSTGHDWKTAGYWASLRAAAPLATDDGMNFLRIKRDAPVGIKYWELGNELYGNGYFTASSGSPGWEPDMHVPYNGSNGTARLKNPALAPSVYGAGIKAFAAAMKAVDPSIKLGGVVNDPAAESAYPGFNDGALQAGCAAMDFAAVHWYPGVSAVPQLVTKAKTDIPTLFSALHSKMMMFCGAAGATMPIAVTEWGPNTLYNESAILGRTWHPTSGMPSQTQIGGIFAAESYAAFMEQGALALHWAQLHDNQYLMSDPPVDTPGFGYHGQLIAHYLASGGDAMKPTTSTVATLLSHASLRADGGVAVMLTNTSGTAAANVTVNVTGGMLACGGLRYTYAPTGGASNLDGAVTTGPIFSATNRTSVNVAVPAYAVVV
ncbi:MAG: hypothetical protein ABI560_07265, partial [Myxococcales bacterium]